MSLFLYSSLLLSTFLLLHSNSLSSFFSSLSFPLPPPHPFRSFSLHLFHHLPFNSLLLLFVTSFSPLSTHFFFHFSLPCSYLCLFSLFLSSTYSFYSSSTALLFHSPPLIHQIHQNDQYSVLHLQYFSNQVLIIM